MKYFCLFVVAILGAIPPARADNYEVSVTRKGSNLYKVDGEDVLIHTRYCYQYSYSEEAFLRMSGTSGEIVFLDAGGKCDVKAVFGLIDQAAGKFSVNVTREDDDWYSILGQDLFVKTSSCFEFAYGEEAVLSIVGGSYGSLHVGNSKCTVEGIYSKLRL